MHESDIWMPGTVSTYGRFVYEVFLKIYIGKWMPSCMSQIDHHGGKWNHIRRLLFISTSRVTDSVKDRLPKSLLIGESPYKEEANLRWGIEFTSGQEHRYKGMKTGTIMWSWA